MLPGAGHRREARHGVHVDRAVARAAEPVVAADEAPRGAPVEPREGDDLLHRQARDRRGPLGRARPDVLGELVRGVGVPAHVRPVRVALGEEHVHHRAGQRGVRPGPEGEVHVRPLRRARAVGIDHDQGGAAALRARHVGHHVHLGVDRVPAPDHHQVGVLADLAQVGAALDPGARDPPGVRQGHADRRVPARVAHRVAEPVDPVPLDQPHGAGVEVGPHRLRPVARRRPDERLGHGVERLVPGDPRELPGALRADAAERVEEPVGVMDALGVAPHLLADDAGRVGVARGAPHPADRAGVEALDLERARARAVVRADGGHHLEPAAGRGGLGRAGQRRQVRRGHDPKNTLGAGPGTTPARGAAAAGGHRRLAVVFAAGRALPRARPEVNGSRVVVIGGEVIGVAPPTTPPGSRTRSAARSGSPAAPPRRLRVGGQWRRENGQSHHKAGCGAAPATALRAGVQQRKRPDRWSVMLGSAKSLDNLVRP